MSAEKRRKKLEYTWQTLEVERSSYDGHWHEISKFLAPRRAQFTPTDRNQGQVRLNKIINGRAILASRTLRSALLASILPKNQPWFEMAPQDPSLRENEEAKLWLHDTTSVLRTIFLKSNLHAAADMVFGDAIDYGTGCCIQEEDFQSILRFHAIPIGSYVLSTDSTGRVVGFAREVGMSPYQLITEFGEFDGNTLTNKEKFTESMLEAYERGDYQSQIIVRHHVYQNEDYVPGSVNPEESFFRSAYYIRHHTQSPFTRQTNAMQLGMLRERPYNYNPIHTMRWEVLAGDTYANNCPGMMALGDIKQLQKGEQLKLKAIAKTIDPPLQIPSSLRRKKVSQLPGENTVVPRSEAGVGIRPVHEVRFDINAMVHNQQEVEQRIREYFYEHISLMLTMSDRREITATEINERTNEKMISIGPVYERADNDFLTPLVNGGYAVATQRGFIAPMPEQLQSAGVKVEYISVMAQAHRAISLGRMDNMLSRIQMLAQMDPTVLDKIDFDQMVDEYDEGFSLAPGTVRPDEEAAMIREQRLAQQQAQQQAAMAQQLASAAKDASRAETADGGTVLDSILGGAN